jgi:hypothetical protein
MVDKKGCDRWTLQSAFQKKIRILWNEKLYNS